VLVKRVIDGDTVELSTGEKVRLIGVDTPETKDLPKPVQYFGKEVTAFTRQLVEGKPVHLEYDQPRQDKYARTLAYVYLEDGTLVNVKIIRQRHAWAHDKVMILDGETVITGSYNWTVAADEQNGENLLMIRDPRLAKVYTENWQRHAHTARHTGLWCRGGRASTWDESISHAGVPSGWTAQLSRMAEGSEERKGE
jgi:phosphatidylserine/phosphatidylglycerophosphate/cardiolipin synthase-like enzyme